MFVSDDEGDDEIFEFNLACPFNIIAGKCPSITENKERTGIAEAQIETAKRAINMSTNSALNRLKWIRRNKDKENLSNQNAKLNFSGTMLSTLSPLPISSFKKISNHKTNKEDNKNYFHWSEGDISLGRIGKNKNASRKENLTNAITYGVDKFIALFADSICASAIPNLSESDVIEGQPPAKKLNGQGSLYSLM